MYLVDSDRTIGYLKGIGRIVTFVDGLRLDGIAISVVTYAEVSEGVVYGRNRGARTEEWISFLRAVPVIDIARAIANQFAAIRGSLRAAGMLIPDADIWIAATAMEHDLTLVTGNLRHFERIAGLRLLG